MIGVYVHIPFCVKKCNYCDFNSFDNKNSLKEIYTEKIIEEIENFKGDLNADTVFFGGGTPTTLRLDLLERIICAVNNKFNTKNCEFTIEANPATIKGEGLLLLRKNGVNRLSIGVQSANNDELKALGRIHSFEDFVTTFNLARDAGFDNINADIMFGLPDQTLNSFKKTLEEVVKLNPEHISCYSLIVEPNTPFYNMKLNLPDEETEREMYHYAVSYLEQMGYIQYEISNFAKMGMSCRHNIKYWERNNYIGFGLGASSLIDNVRYKNCENLIQYIENNLPEKEILTTADALAEHIFLGLRKTDGFNIKEAEELYNIDFYKKYKDVIDKYLKLDLITYGENMALTKEGISVSNIIMSDFV